MTRLVYLLLLSILLYSCESVVNLDVEQLPNSIVVNSLFAPNPNPDTPPSNFQVQLLESRVVTSNADFPSIPDATVQVFHNKGLLETLVYNSTNNLYQSTTASPEEGEVYSLKVTHPDYPEVTAESSVPKGGILGSANLGLRTGQPSPIQDGTTIEKIPIEFEINDPIGDNYYHILFFHELKRYQIVGLDTISIDSITYISNFDVTEKNKYDAILFGAPPNVEEYGLYGAYLTDKNFNGTKTNLDFTLQYALNPAVHRTGDIGIQVRTVSKEYYDFHTTAIQNLRTGANPFSNDPVAVHSNIENGLGIFAGFAVQTKFVR